MIPQLQEGVGRAGKLRTTKARRINEILGRGITRMVGNLAASLGIFLNTVYY